MLSETPRSYKPKDGIKEIVKSYIYHVKGICLGSYNVVRIPKKFRTQELTPKPSQFRASLAACERR